MTHNYPIKLLVALRVLGDYYMEMAGGESQTP